MIFLKKLLNLLTYNLLSLYKTDRQKDESWIMPTLGENKLIGMAEMLLNVCIHIPRSCSEFIEIVTMITPLFFKILVLNFVATER